MLARPVILDACAADAARYLPESGGIPDGPGSADDCPSLSMEGCCRDGIRGTPLRTNMRGLPISTELGCKYLIALMIWIRETEYIGRGWTS